MAFHRGAALTDDLHAIAINRFNLVVVVNRVGSDATVIIYDEQSFVIEFCLTHGRERALILALWSYQGQEGR